MKQFASFVGYENENEKGKNKMESYKVNLEKVFELLEMIFDDEVSVNAMFDYEVNEFERLLATVIMDMLNLKINSGFITQKEVLLLVVELKRVLIEEIKNGDKTLDLYTFSLTQSDKKNQLVRSILEEINIFLAMEKENKDDEVGGAGNEVS